MTDAVVITGLGTLSASGAGQKALAADLAGGRHRATPIESKLEGLASGVAAQVQGIDLSRWVPPGLARRMSRPSRFAVAAAVMALESARIGVGDEDPSLAVSMASNFGPLSYTQRLLDQIHDEGPGAASPSLFTECVVNAPASQVSIVTGASGPNTTISGREAGPLLATARGCTDVVEGRASRALVGTCEEVTPLQFGVLSRLGALAPTQQGRLIEARPFDRRRRGFLVAEGATVLVVEKESRAIRRGVVPIARIRAWGAAFDATASRVGWGRGAAILARGLVDCLTCAGIALASVRLIVSGASGARAGDWLEARALQDAWGDLPLPPVVAPKAVTGEYGGGFLAAAVLALRGSIAAQTDFEIDPAIGLRPQGVEQPPEGCVLVSSLASGGSASWLVLESL